MEIKQITQIKLLNEKLQVVLSKRVTYIKGIPPEVVIWGKYAYLRQYPTDGEVLKYEKVPTLKLRD